MTDDRPPFDPALLRALADGTLAPHADAWPPPQPMTATFAPEPYPVDALPMPIGAAVAEVVGFVQAPVALVAASALAALSVACQAHVDVQRAEKLQGPCGLFLLSIADSGERKSTCDGYFAEPVRQHDAAQAAAARPLLKKHEADMGAWTAERDGLLAAIRSANAKQGTSADTAELKAALGALHDRQPEPPRVPRLLLGDATPEALAWTLSQRWPSAGILSAEAGSIFGAHGMGKDSITRNLALLNTLWDGGTHLVGRRTSESFTVRGARLTLGLLVQEAALRDFFAKSGTLARGTGFLARFLIAWPQSTQGYRPFREAPETWPHLERFKARLTDILRRPVAQDEDGALEPALMTMTPDAKSAWIAFHDAVESQLAEGGELRDVRDVASKSADNAARLAALFQMFETGPDAPVSLDSFERASRIVAWHLTESRRFFGELALPADLADAARLDAWLIGHCERERVGTVAKNHVRQHGPLRDIARLDGAIIELAGMDRLRATKDGRRNVIALNPALLEAARESR